MLDNTIIACRLTAPLPDPVFIFHWVGLIALNLREVPQEILKYLWIEFEYEIFKITSISPLCSMSYNPWCNAQYGKGNNQVWPSQSVYTCITSHSKVKMKTRRLPLSKPVIEFCTSIKKRCDTWVAWLFQMLVMNMSWEHFDNFYECYLVKKTSFNIMHSKRKYRLEQFRYRRDDCCAYVRTKHHLGICRNN